MNSTSISELLFAHENDVRLYVLLAGFGLFALWESFRPRRSAVASTPHRWTINAGLSIGNTALVLLAFPVMTVAFAEVVRRRGCGLLNQWALPDGVAFVIALIVLDLVRYGQHLALHRVPGLWRLHEVHHTDVDYDCTTGLRFHPLEALFGQTVMLGAVLAAGPSPLAVLAFELLYLFSGFMTHANVGLPERIDAAARLVVVTPDMHRVHHSTLPIETNSNYGGLLPWWDRIFGTYRPQPRGSHEEMTIGLDAYRDDRKLTFARLLAMPFASRGQVLRSRNRRADSASATSKRA